jgi:hypothetical protein
MERKRDLDLENFTVEHNARLKDFGIDLKSDPYEIIGEKYI